MEHDYLLPIDINPRSKQTAISFIAEIKQICNGILVCLYLFLVVHIGISSIQYTKKNVTQLVDVTVSFQA